MISWLKDLFSESAEKIVDSTMKGLDTLFTSDEERLLVKAKMKEAVLQQQLELAKLTQEKFNTELQEQTKRWISDNKNGNWLTRSVRPYAMALTVTTVMFVFISVGFGWMTFDPSILNALLMFAGSYVGFYTTSRGMEKVSKIRLKDKDE